MKSGKTAKWILLLCCLGAGSIWAETAEQLIAQGDRYWAEQKTEMAEQQFKAAIEMAPESALAHERLAAFYLAQNQNQQAIEEYKTAITLKPEDPSLFVAICLAYLHEGAYSASQAMCNRALELDPESENARQLQQYIYVRIKAGNNRAPVNFPLDK